MTGDRGFGNEIKQALESLLAREQALKRLLDLIAETSVTCHKAP